jgi:hypothetical protein
LSGHDDGLCPTTREFNGALLNNGDRFQRKLNTQITASDHNAIKGIDNLFEIIHRLRLFDLGDDWKTNAFLVHDLVDANNVLRVAHEAQGNEISTEFETPTKVCFVLLAHCGNIDGNARKINSLVIRNGTRNFNDGSHGFRIYCGHTK